MNQLFKKSATITALASLMLLCIICYWPGLHGEFLFDDFGNLDALGALGPVHDWASFCRYITSGHADPTGRPLALLTFLLDARDWPASPLPFKRTNLLIHLLNSALLWRLLLALGHLAGQDKSRPRKAALVGAALWALHPLLVSTTLYIVQREAMLAATCTLAGLLAWLHGRQLWLQGGHKPRGIAWCLIGLVAFTFLGALAKANGVLLPLLALSIEACFPEHPFSDKPKAPTAYRRLLLLFAGVPSGLLAGYLLWTGARGVIAGNVISGRSWTLAQRLLSEPRVLMDYLQLLWLPRPWSNGLFNDQYVASTSLLHPLATLLALTTLLLLLCAAALLRRRQPVLALAVFFFFSGQLLESTSIPLELYYEHRNYLPALLMFWPLAWWLADSRTLAGVKLILLISLPLGLAWMTYLRANEWGHSDTQALLWARINPKSPRAQAYAAMVEMSKGLYLSAVNRLERAIADYPADPQLAFTLIDAHCGTGTVSAQVIADATYTVRNATLRGSVYAAWLDHALSLANSGKCLGLGLDDVRRITEAGLANPALQAPGTEQDFTFVQAQVELAQRQALLALKNFKHALDIQVRPDLALRAAATLGSNGHPRLGLNMLDYYISVSNKAVVADPGMPHFHAWVLAYQNYWPGELKHLHDQLLADAVARHASP
ncbi:MAG: tetratricopeptide repeat protein [Dyella sp.]|uniref:tetratricopeptide repeat protein n=1 Tax=Dyella sp. TaxID=1869338 RepID=UPI003F7E48A8